MRLEKQLRTYSENEERVAERRKHIAQVASTLFVKHGFRETNTRDLTQALGMSKGALYHYISSKEDILYLVLKFATENRQRLVTRMEEYTVGLKPVHALKELIRMYFTSVDEFQDMYMFTSRAIVDLSPEDRKFLFQSEESLLEYIQKVLQKGVMADEFKINDVRLVAHEILMAGNTWALRRWHLRKHYTIHEYIGEFTDYIIQAVCGTATPGHGDTSDNSTAQEHEPAQPVSG